MTIQMRMRTDDEANALSGVTDPGTQATHTTIGKFDHAADRKRLDARMLDLLAAAAMLRVDPAGDDASIYVAAGRAMIAGSLVTCAGETIDLSAHEGSTVYVWLASTGMVGHDVSTNGWPATAHLKLAEVEVADGEVDRTGILDRRPEALYSDAADVVANKRVPLATAADETAMLALTTPQGTLCLRADSDPPTVWRLVGTDPSTLDDWRQVAMLNADGELVGPIIVEEEDVSNEVREANTLTARNSDLFLHDGSVPGGRFVAGRGLVFHGSTGSGGVEASGSTTTKATLTEDQFDPGSGYDANDREFTVPVAGHYLALVKTPHIEGTAPWASYLHHNQQNHILFSADSIGSEGYHLTSHCMLFNCSAGDKISLSVTGNDDGAYVWAFLELAIVRVA